jgi:hypothetical protein
LFVAKTFRDPPEGTAEIFRESCMVDADSDKDRRCVALETLKTELSKLTRRRGKRIKISTRIALQNASVGTWLARRSRIALSIRLASNSPTHRATNLGQNFP